MDAESVFENLIELLAKGASERQAFKSGEVDAIIDPASGNTLLLPAAQAALREDQARLRSLAALNSDGDWTQDADYRFVSHSGATIGNPPTSNGEGILGMTLWELMFDNMSEADWQAHRSQLKRRATFRDLDLRYLDRAGEVREISISGEPVFDSQRRFKGYRGVTRDITARRCAKQLPKRGRAVANSLLAKLPRDHYQQLLASLEPVTLTFGEVLYEPGQPIRQVYFPGSSLVSLLITLAEPHQSMAVGLVGREGMVGIPLVLGVDNSIFRAIVQGNGTAMRMETARFRQEFLQSAPLQRELYRYTHALRAQVAQIAACNHYHRVEARLARWLLMTFDRARSNKMYLTHEFLADMLGAQRAGVTRAASTLQERKLIRYSRGHLHILDRRGLEAASCRCYRIIKDLRF
jgi:PAS domain S-box-containing protein